MERPPSVVSRTAWVIIIIYTVGLAGLVISGTMHLFLALVPFHLSGMFALLLYNHKGGKLKLLLFAMFVFLTGYTVEYIGVTTGVLFGRYAYGPTLGYHVAGIPFIIGINWFLLVYATGAVINDTMEKRPVLKVLKGALILVMLDLLIEPVAIRYNYWHWQGGVIPLQNYFCWFIVSATFLWLFEAFKFPRQNRVVFIFLIVQFLFFGILDLFRWLPV